MERAELSRIAGGLGCAEPAGGYTFLCDPSWSENDRSAVAETLRDARSRPEPEQGWLCIRTGGSSGGLKFVRHDEATISAAIDGFCRHFALDRIHTVGVLPPWHVSGLMARLRCAATGGEYLDCGWKALEAGRLPPLRRGVPWVLSLVPTQLQRLLAAEPAVNWLRQFGVVFLGGGPVWPTLADAAAAAGIRVSLSYGMTETAAMVAAQRPEEFLAGDRSAGRPLPHARIDCEAGGRITIAGDSLFRGYFPDDRAGEVFTTQDLGRIDVAGRVHVLGRVDAVIITGGEKVQPAAVEAALRASGEFADIAVIGVPDPQWGEIVVACFPASDRAPDAGRALQALAPYERPKRLVAIANWPRNAQGKINRAALLEAVLQSPPADRP